MEKHLEALKAALDSASAGMGETKSFKSNAAAFKAASVAFHEFLRNGINECGGKGDYYLEDANVLATDIQYAFDDGEAEEDANVRNVPVYSTLNHVQQGIGARA